MLLKYQNTVLQYNYYNIMKKYVSLGAALMLGTVLARGRRD
jgi:hypothetical protein